MEKATDPLTLVYFIPGFILILTGGFSWGTIYKITIYSC